MHLKVHALQRGTRSITTTLGDSMTVWMIASILHTLTGHAWSVFTVHGIRAACEVTVSHGQAYANGCLR